MVTPNSRYAYVTNTANGTISSYAVARSGKLSLVQGIAATSGAGPIDAAISASGRNLYVLNAGARTVSSFKIGSDASLTNGGAATGLPAGANGLAAN